MTLPICRDCAKRNAQTDTPDCHAACSVCGIKRACFGDDPDPFPPRKIKIPEWPHTDPLR
jgi:hypothetical protein